jgi:hypothetical protein
MGIPDLGIHREQPREPADFGLVQAPGPHLPKGDLRERIAAGNDHRRRSVADLGYDQQERNQ